MNVCNFEPCDKDVGAEHYRCPEHRYCKMCGERYAVIGMYCERHSDIESMIRDISREILVGR